MTKAELAEQIVCILATVDDDVPLGAMVGLEGANKVSLEWVLKKIQEKKEMFETSVMAIEASRTQQTNETNK